MAAQETGRAPLTLSAVTKRWGKRQPAVLDRLDLTLDSGSTTWIGGRNGVGKTTLLRIAAGLIDPESGTVDVWGLTPRRSRARYQQLVSLLPAGDRGLYARLTVRSQLEFCARIAMLPHAGFQARIERALERFDLSELQARRVDRMSMGQRQRLRIAMTFLPEPEVVLLDEPLTSIDQEGGELLRGAISELISREGTVLWCSPDSEPADIDFDARWLLEHGALTSA